MNQDTAQMVNNLYHELSILQQHKRDIKNIPTYLYGSVRLQGGGYTYNLQFDYLEGGDFAKFIESYTKRIDNRIRSVKRQIRNL